MASLFSRSSKAAGKAPFKTGNDQTKKKTYQWVYKPTEKNLPMQRGEVMAESVSVARALLRLRNQKITTIKAKKTKFGRITEDDLVVFMRQLAAMIKAGVPFLDALKNIQSSTEKEGLRNLLGEMANKIASGDSIEKTFAAYPKYFDAITVAMLGAAEQGGILDNILNRLAVDREKSRVLKKKIKSAMMYPGITVLVMFAVVAILMIKVIPVFSHLFKSFGGKLPALTQIVVDISYWMQSNVTLVILIPVLIIVGYLYAYRHFIKFRWFADRLVLRLPVFGKLAIKAATARFCQVFAGMQKAGVPILEMLETLSHVSGNMLIDKVVADARNDVRSGGKINTAMQNTIFPALAVQMIEIGENSGNLEEMLNKSGEFFEAEVNEIVNRLSTLMEPIIMVLLGVVIGTMVIAMYLPMLDMGQVILKGTGQG